jgi:hypothetical protein
MNCLPLLWLAQASGGLLSDTFIAWFAILGGAAGFISLAITLVRMRTSSLAATTPTAPVPAPVTPAVVATPAPVAYKLSPPPAIDESIPGEVMALISAAVAMTLGKHARIAAVAPVPAPPVELLQQWSIEGRRQIYSSHQIR